MLTFLLALAWLGVGVVGYLAMRIAAWMAREPWRRHYRHTCVLATMLGPVFAGIAGAWLAVVTVVRLTERWWSRWGDDDIVTW